MIKPIVISFEEGSQDIILFGPQVWLNSAKAATSAIYSGQPNPRDMYSSSFIAGRYLGINLFARSYHVNTIEMGTERRGGLITLGLTSPDLTIETLAWIYRLIFFSFSQSLLDISICTTLSFEDDVVATAVDKFGARTGHRFVDALSSIFPDEGDYVSLSSTRSKSIFRKRRSADIIALNFKVGRDVLYSFALDILREDLSNFRMRFSRSVFANVFVQNLGDNIENGIMLLRSKTLKRGFSEIVINDLRKFTLNM